MSLIDLALRRRRGSASSPTYRPKVELLETRECPSLTAPALQLAATSPTQVKLTWTNVASESGYRVFRWDGARTILVTTVAANVRTFTVSQLQPNQTQWFTVEAFNFATSARSAWVSINTPAETIAAPTGVKVVNASTTEITLGWNAAAGATGYRIFQWNGVAGEQIGTTASTVRAFKVSNLTPGTVYYFYVQAFNNTNTAASDWVTAQTSAVGITAPANLKAQTVNSTTINVSWNDVAGETGYRVYRWNGVNGVSPVLIATLSANTVGYQATGLLAGKTYWFYVQAFNATNFANTGWVTAATPGTPLTAPTQVTAVPVAPHTIRVSWTEPAAAAGYRVFVWNGFGWTLMGTVAKGTSSVNIGGLASFRTHWFVVQAFTEGFGELVNSDFVYANL